MPRRLLIGLVLGAVAVAAVLAAATGGSGPEPEPASRPIAEPKLSAAQRERVRSLLRGDEELGGILKGNPVEIAQMGPWSGAAHEFIGASAIVRISEPLSFPMMNWPVVDADPPGDAPYEEHELELRAENVTELVVNVDLRSERVVGIDPGGEDAKLTPGESVELEEPSGY
ncbi:MAG TPA: hypothetical protein VFQ12_08340 [Thermoleophilaceae bacterium]|nr:hypothetical protein [Thermoleophilaceae bacterium]